MMEQDTKMVTGATTVVTVEEAATSALPENLPAGEAAGLAGEATEEAAQTALGTRATLDPARLQSILESLLLAADRPLEAGAMSRLIPGARAAEVRRLLHEWKAECEAQNRGFVLTEVGSGWQLRTNLENSEYVAKLYQNRPRRLSPAAMEVLAIVAYRQPTTRGEVEDIRGVDSGGVIHALLERRLARIIGHKEEPGRPLLYGTTREFLELFGLKDLNSLPTLQEFLELSPEQQELVEQETGEAARAGETPAILGGMVEKAAVEDFSPRPYATAAEVAADAGMDELEYALKGMEKTARAVVRATGLVPEKKPPEAAAAPRDAATDAEPDEFDDPPEAAE